FEGGSTQSRPSKLSIPHLGRSAGAKRLLERTIDKPHAQSHCADQLGGGRVFRQLHSQCFDAAPALQKLALPQHAFPLSKAEPDRIANVLPPRLMSVEKCAFKLRPQIQWSRADGRRADESRSWSPSREQPLDVVARHQHIAVRDRDPRRGGCPPPLHDIV